MDWFWPLPVVEDEPVLGEEVVVELVVVLVGEVVVVCAGPVAGEVVVVASAGTVAVLCVVVVSAWVVVCVAEFAACLVWVERVGGDAVEVGATTTALAAWLVWSTGWTVGDEVADDAWWWRR